MAATAAILTSPPTVVALTADALVSHMSNLPFVGG
jgi:hypothetical protein